MAATVTWRDVEATLGRALSTETQQAQAALWIDQAFIIIGARAAQQGTTLEALDQGILELVVTEAVAARIKKPDDATEVQVQIDDAQTTKRYESSTGQIVITDDWWNLLFPASAGGAFSISFGA